MTVKDSTTPGSRRGIRLEVADLEGFYGRIPGPPADPFGVFAWEVVARKATPAACAAAFAALRRARALTPDAVAKAPAAALERALAAAGPGVDLRLGALRAGADAFRRQPALARAICGPLRGALRALRALPQLDAAAVSRMLLFAGGHAVVPVDARVERVVRRLGYVGGEGRRASLAVRRLLQADAGGGVDSCRRAYLYLSHHAALTCTERDPHCGVCPLRAGCGYALSPGRPAGEARLS